MLPQEGQQEGSIHLLIFMKLLLEQLCMGPTPDSAVMCKLLCCSRASADLVHELCAGKLTLQLCPPVKDKLDRLQLTTWLAKHARLLRHLSLEWCHSDVEE
jgi:hypothetical protein